MEGRLVPLGEGHSFSYDTMEWDLNIRYFKGKLGEKKKKRTKSLGILNPPRDVLQKSKTLSRCQDLVRSEMSFWAFIQKFTHLVVINSIQGLQLQKEISFLRKNFSNNCNPWNTLSALPNLGAARWYRSLLLLSPAI